MFEFLKRQILLLFFSRFVGAHPDRQQHGVSIQRYVNLGESLTRISHMETDCTGLNFGEFFANLPPFISQIPDFIYWTVLIFDGVAVKSSNWLNRNLRKGVPQWLTSVSNIFPALFFASLVINKKLNGHFVGPKGWVYHNSNLESILVLTAYNCKASSVTIIFSSFK